VVVAYDGDPAGDRAACTAYGRLALLFEKVLSARMPDGHDPASLAAADSASMSRSLQSAGPLADQLVDDILQHYAPKLANAEARICALHESARLIARLRPEDVARQVARVADRLRLSAAEVTRNLIDDVGRRKRRPQPAPARSPYTARPADRAPRVGPRCDHDQREGWRPPPEREGAHADGRCV